MKKHLFAMLPITAALSLSTTANAQFELASNTKKIIATSFVNEFESTPAFKNFHKDFPGSGEESWTKTNEGYSVWFTLKGLHNRAYLTKGGQCEGLMRYYGEGDLPKEVRRLVKSRYYDYSITGVQEVTCGHATAYLVTIEDKTTWKVMRVADGEMDVREEYTKGE